MRNDEHTHAFIPHSSFIIQQLSLCRAAIAALWLVFAAVQPAAAQNYPTKPLRVIVAYAPGGSTDIAARMIGEELGQAFNWRVVIDNRAGGGTLIGTET